jgi:hypothetical protein
MSGFKRSTHLSRSSLPHAKNAMAREYQIEYLKKHGIDIPGARRAFQHR